MGWGTAILETLGGMVTDALIESIYNSAIVEAGAGDISFGSIVNLNGYYIWREINQTYTSTFGSIHFNSATYYDKGQTVDVMTFPDSCYIGVEFDDNDGYISLVTSTSYCYVRIYNGSFTVNGEIRPSTTQLGILSTPPTITQQNLVNNALNYPTQNVLGAAKGVLGSKYRSKANGGSANVPAWMTNDSFYAFPEGGEDIKDLQDLNIYLPILYQDWENLYDHPFYIEPELYDILPVGTILPDGSEKQEETEPTEENSGAGCYCEFDFAKLEAILANIDFSADIDYNALASAILASINGLDVNANLDYDSLAGALLAGLAGLNVEASLDYDALAGALVGAFADLDMNATLDYDSFLDALIENLAEIEFNVNFEFDFDYDKFADSIVNAFYDSDININIDWSELESIFNDLNIDASIDYDEVMSPSEFYGVLGTEEYELAELDTSQFDLQLESVPELVELSVDVVRGVSGLSKAYESALSSFGLLPVLSVVVIVTFFVRVFKG